MPKTFEARIKELEKEKEELNLNILKNQKSEYEEKLYEILDNQNDEIDGTEAVSTLKKAKLYRKKIKEINEKIENNPDILKNIELKISKYQERKERVRNIPLYRNTEEGIADILGEDPIYQYAKDTHNEELAKKLKNRSLTVDEYTELSEKMYTDLFEPFLKEKDKKSEDKNKEKTVTLPEGMKEQIYEELKDNKDLGPQDIEKLLKKELKKNGGEIKLSHIKNTFKDKFDQAYQYIKRLIINYPGFKIIDNQEKKTKVSVKTKNDKLIEEAIQNGSMHKQEKDKAKEDTLKLLEETGKIEDTKIRCEKYIELFEKNGCKFSNKQDFLEQLTDVINSQTHIQFDNGIQNLLLSIILTNLKPEKSRGQSYLSYKLNSSFDSRRIIAYPNGEIFTVRPHDEYEEIINKRPPVDKRRK